MGSGANPGLTSQQPAAGSLPGPGTLTPGCVLSLLTGVSLAEARQPGKSPHFSVNWVMGNADVEVIDGTTGKRSCGGSSRLCKHVFSARWARLYGKVQLRSGGGRPSCPRLPAGRHREGPPESQHWSEQG